MALLNQQGCSLLIGGLKPLWLGVQVPYNYYLPLREDTFRPTSKITLVYGVRIRPSRPFALSNSLFCSFVVLHRPFAVSHRSFIASLFRSLVVSNRPFVVSHRSFAVSLFRSLVVSHHPVCHAGIHCSADTLMWWLPLPYVPPRFTFQQRPWCDG